MLSEKTLHKIANIFNGDAEETPYTRKSGPELVRFFNERLRFSDVYQSPFPSRWYYVVQNLRLLESRNALSTFFTVILSWQYLLVDLDCTETEVKKASCVARTLVNKVLAADQTKVDVVNKKAKLIKINADLVELGKGGFATTYLQISTGLVVKKLNPNSAVKDSFRRRFKREFDIMSKLHDDPGVIKVYDYDSDTCSYTMERANQTLKDYFELQPSLNDETRISIVRDFLSIFARIHLKGICHRDISPSNILFVGDKMKVSDFGLGKDLTALNSYNTTNTNNYGTYAYAAPELIGSLGKGDIKSDVYSLGKLINYTMTGSPDNTHHVLCGPARKATVKEPSRRYDDANKLLEAVSLTLKRMNEVHYETSMRTSIQRGLYDRNIAEWIDSLSPRKLCDHIIAVSRFHEALLKHCEQSRENADTILNFIEDSMREACGYSYEANDNFAYFAAELLLSDNVDFDEKQRAAEIVRYVAHDVNRFCIQHLIEDHLINRIDPMLEELLRN